MLDAIGRPRVGAEWLEQELLAGRRIMGWDTDLPDRDPRAAVLERAVERLEREGHRTPRLELARAVERAAEDVLRAVIPTAAAANVEFYTAVSSTRSACLARRSARSSPAARWWAGWRTSTSSVAPGRVDRPESRTWPRPDLGAA
jgi:citrate synthase